MNNANNTRTIRTSVEAIRHVRRTKGSVSVSLDSLDIPGIARREVSWDHSLPVGDPLLGPQKADYQRIIIRDFDENGKVIWESRAPGFGAR